MRAGPSLEDDKREVALVDELARDNLIGRFGDGVPNLRVKTVRSVDVCSSLLEDAESFDQRRWEAFCGSTNVKILKRSENVKVRNKTGKERMSRVGGEW